MLTRQREQCAAVAKGEAENTVFLLEHAPVITLGREADRAHLLLGQEALTAQGVSVVETDRGGDVTYHGPGQLVAYPILDLRQWRQSVGWYLRRLEQVLIDQLRDYGLQGERVEGLTGVWVADAKVAAVGIGLRNWVTFHGIALNVTTNMDHFGFIVPCGIQDKPVTSLEVLLGKRCPTLEVATDDFVRHFERVFSEAV
jgi:lipoate-protein ligase B